MVKFRVPGTHIKHTRARNMRVQIPASLANLDSLAFVFAVLGAEPRVSLKSD